MYLNLLCLFSYPYIMALLKPPLHTRALSVLRITYHLFGYNCLTKLTDAITVFVIRSDADRLKRRANRTQCSETRPKFMTSCTVVVTV